MIDAAALNLSAEGLAPFSSCIKTGPNWKKPSGAFGTLRTDAFGLPLPYRPDLKRGYFGALL